MTTNTLSLGGDLAVTLTLDHEREDFYVTLPPSGIPETAQARALTDALSTYGLEAMPHEECAWDFTDDGVRVYCAEVA